ncbi:uncharacterized protein MJAP1_003829 [Malassezia japonica]|uniref:FHA domain-containing protein n=1 Tax=Malassezia japonica TaxID=223818 RepID=A0AAF0F9H2_9BASI|nr:uncharacterized protein MJAP1_003829 [Malassezia japonica]WFD40838.1 hypothetical protein MJAP1_003829 [Malassezia japonica]
MLGSRVQPPTPVPSSDHDVPSSPSGLYAKHASYMSRPAMATPPPSSPTRDHPFSLFAEALEHAVPRGVSPTKRAAPVVRREIVVENDPAVGIRANARGIDALQANYTHTLVIGRAKVLDRAAAVAASPAFMGSQPAVNVCLPGTAKHVSRVHALVRWVPFTSAVETAPHGMAGTFVLRIVGQNGLVVNGKRYRAGHVLRLEPGRTLLDFFGVRLRFVVESVARAAPKPALPAPSAVSPTKEYAMPTGIPPSSPARMERAMSVDDSEPDSPTRPVQRPVVRAEPKPVPAARPLGEVQNVLAREPKRADKRDKVSKPVEKKAELEAKAAEKASKAVEKPAEKAKVVEKAAEKATKPVEKPVEELVEKPVEKPVERLVERPAEKLAGKPINVPVPADLDTPEPKRAETPPTDHARMLVDRLAPTYDLAGLLAGAIVFHRTATISTSEAVRSVLSSNPGMMRGEAGARALAFSPSKRRLPHAGDTSSLPEHGQVIGGWETDARWQLVARRAWHERLEEELQREPMFGVIQRPGKDTSGNPLECWYHYDKENDPDVERAQNLGAFVKPMRNVVRSQKPIFWKKSEYGRATSGVGQDGGMDDKLPYSPRSNYDEGEESDTRRKRSRKADTGPAALEEPEQTWDKQGDLEWHGARVARGKSRSSTPSAHKKSKLA